jgi:DNA-binding CsgD family transcriptional regulator
MSASPAPSRREIAADIARLAADGLTVGEIARVMDLHRCRVLKIAAQFRIRLRRRVER